MIRKLKVYRQFRDYNTEVPTIILKGKWLKRYGFDYDSIIHVECNQDQLTITVQRDNNSDYCQNIIDK